MKKILLILISFILLNKSVIFADNIDKLPNVVAEGAILMDYKTGRVLWGKNETEPLAMASTTKIMTAILAIENGDLEDTVIVSKKASNTPPVKMFLKENEKIQLKNLLYALMLQSSNDAAIAIAEHISGSVEKFCDLMTKRAYEIGAKDTIFRTPNGLDSEDHHSTAYDMALITKYALQNKTFLDIINTRQISIKSSKSTYNIINKNRLLSEFNGANGVKTGYTGKAGHCFVGSGERDDMQLISVVLASGWGNKGKQQKWVDTKQLLNYGFENYKYETVLKKEDCKDIVKINKGNKNSISLYYEKDFILPIKESELKSITIKNEIPEILEAPIYENQKIGKAKIFIGNDNVGEINILAGEQVSRKTLKSNIEKVIKNWINILN